MFVKIIHTSPENSPWVLKIAADNAVPSVCGGSVVPKVGADAVEAIETG